MAVTVLKADEDVEKFFDGQSRPYSKAMIEAVKEIIRDFSDLDLYVLINTTLLGHPTKIIECSVMEKKTNKRIKHVFSPSENKVVVS